MGALLKLQFHGKPRAMFRDVANDLVSLKNYNAKYPTLNLLSVSQLTEVNDLIARMNELLAQKISC